MATIKKVSELLKISPETIRMYERYGILKTDRSEGGYRIFSRQEITILIKSRILQTLGFSMREIARMMKDISYEELMNDFSEQERKLEAEIELLSIKREYLKERKSCIFEIHQKVGLCEEVECPTYYLLPVLDEEGLKIDYLQEKLSLWNEISYLRQDVRMLPFDSLKNGENGYRIFYGAEQAEVERRGIELHYTQKFAAQHCVKYYFERKEGDGGISAQFQPVFTYLEEHGLVSNGDVLTFLPFFSGGGGVHYQYALIPVRKA